MTELGTRQTMWAATAAKNPLLRILETKEQVVAMVETRCYKGVNQDFGSIFR